MKELKGKDGRVKKRVFETLWSRSSVYLTDRVTFQEEQFFNVNPNAGASRELREIVHPYAISYHDLAPFLGKKTRVTIEVIA